ncbi:MAG: response regulator [Schwartzia sp.]|nr:response regulator [Schwartzia sp. (in: firmicutes)]
MPRSIIYIESTQHLINQAIENKLREAGFLLHTVPPNIDAVNRQRHTADIILYYPEHGDAKTELLLQYLGDLCRDEYKSLCLIGDNAFISQIRETEKNWIAYTYIRPIDMNVISANMANLSGLYDEFRRQKKVLIVDDDSDFLTIMSRWLKNSYHVVGVTSGEDALEYLAQEHPDLILLDYDMPDMDGYEVMERIRRSPLLARIPLIFLTGINDRESVMRIIRHKPDGYMLKSMKKLEILDMLQRFFAESILYRKTSNLVARGF